MKNLPLWVGCLLLTGTSLAVAAPTGSITASPNPCTITSGIVCTTNFDWNSSGATEVIVFVSMDGAAPTNFGCGTSEVGIAAPWIQAGHTYQFSEYGFDTSSNCSLASPAGGTLLGSVSVTGTVGSTDPPPTNFFTFDGLFTPVSAVEMIPNSQSSFVVHLLNSSGTQIMMPSSVNITASGDCTVLTQWLGYTADVPFYEQVTVQSGGTTGTCTLTAAAPGAVTTSHSIQVNQNLLILMYPTNLSDSLLPNPSPVIRITGMQAGPPPSTIQISGASCAIVVEKTDASGLNTWHCDWSGSSLTPGVKNVRATLQTTSVGTMQDSLSFNLFGPPPPPQLFISTSMAYVGDFVVFAASFVYDNAANPPSTTIPPGITDVFIYDPTSPTPLVPIADLTEDIDKVWRGQMLVKHSGAQPNYYAESKNNAGLNSYPTNTVTFTGYTKPTLTMTAPTSSTAFNAVLLAGTPVTVSAMVSDPDHMGWYVQFLSHDTVIGTISPDISGQVNSVTWTVAYPQVGAYSLLTAQIEYPDLKGHSTFAVTPNQIPITIVDSLSTPVVTNSVVTTPVNTPANINLIGTDSNSLPLHYILVTPPTSGTLSAILDSQPLSTAAVNGAGFVTYTPKAGYLGTDSFTFEAYNGLKYSGVATVSIGVGTAPPAPPPVCAIGHSWDPVGGVCQTNYPSGTTFSFGSSLLATEMAPNSVSNFSVSAVNSAGSVIGTQPGTNLSASGACTMTTQSLGPLGFGEIAVLQSGPTPGPCTLTAAGPGVPSATQIITVTQNLLILTTPSNNSDSVILGPSSVIRIQGIEAGPAPSGIQVTGASCGPIVVDSFDAASGVNHWHCDWTGSTLTPGDKAVSASVGGMHDSLAFGLIGPPPPPLVLLSTPVAYSGDYIVFTATQVVDNPANPTSGVKLGIAGIALYDPDSTTPNNPVGLFTLGNGSWTYTMQAHSGPQDHYYAVSTSWESLASAPSNLVTFIVYTKPAVTMIAPTPNSVYVVGSTVTMTAMVTDPDHRAADMLFTAGGTGITFAGSAPGPESYTWIAQKPALTRFVLLSASIEYTDANFKPAFAISPVQIPITVVDYVSTPTVVNSTVTTPVSTAVNINLIGTDPDVLPLHYMLVAGPSHGTLSPVLDNNPSSTMTLTGQGFVTYTPNTGYLGTDKFTFKANNGLVDSNVATISIGVGTAPLPPPTCDANNDGAVNVMDVQVMVNQALGIMACTNDLTGAGTCTILSVQREANACLGKTCVVGP